MTLINANKISALHSSATWFCPSGYEVQPPPYLSDVVVVPSFVPLRVSAKDSSSWAIVFVIFKLQAKTSALVSEVSRDSAVGIATGYGLDD
jgi:hypothetical protein